jgi:hypothetical protein
MRGRIYNFIESKNARERSQTCLIAHEEDSISLPFIHLRNRVEKEAQIS